MALEKNFEAGSENSVVIFSDSGELPALFSTKLLKNIFILLL